MDPIRVPAAQLRPLASGGDPASRGNDPSAASFETLLRAADGEGGLPRSGASPIPVEVRPATSGPSPVPLRPTPGGQESAVQRTELELRAAFLREMLAPLVESLTSGLSGGTPVAGQDIYEFFVSEALSRPLAEGWPLPAVSRPETKGAGTEAGTVAQESMLRSAANAALRTAASRAASGAPRPAVSAAQSAAVSFPVPAPTIAAGESIGEAPPSLGHGTSVGTRGSATVGTPRPATQSNGSATRDVSMSIPDLVSRTAREFALPESLLQAVVQVESSGNPRAVSPMGAQGLMQLMPGTAREVGVEDSFDPEQNLRGGATYLVRQLERFGDLPRALAAYNAGPGAVEKHGGVPPYRETQAYVERVIGLARSLEE